LKIGEHDLRGARFSSSSTANPADDVSQHQQQQQRSFTRVFAPLCVYRGRIYALKRSPKESVEVTRGLKKELKVSKK